MHIPIGIKSLNGQARGQNEQIVTEEYILLWSNVTQLLLRRRGVGVAL